jgi:hypothetical protein
MAGLTKHTLHELLRGGALLDDGDRSHCLVASFISIVIGPPRRGSTQLPHIRRLAESRHAGLARALPERLRFR